MKKITIILVSVIIAVVCALLLWQQVKISRDRDYCQKVVGAWSSEFGSLHITDRFAPDGSFTGQEEYGGLSSTNTIQVAGSWRIKDGSWILSVTNSTNPKAKVPRVGTGRIVRIDSHEFVLVWHGQTNELVWSRVTP